MMRGMQGKGSFTQSEMRIAMAFATSRHERIAQYHNEQGIRTKRGTKIRHFLYASKADVRAALKAVAQELGIRIHTSKV